MRELKFRVWDKTADNPQGRGLKGVMICHDYVMDSDYLKDAINGKYPIMQFTGLTDKDGVDIYEGDILKYIRLMPDLKEVEDTAFVEWCTWSCALFKMYKGERNYFTVFDKICATKCEVIGNIHQDKKMLK